MYFMPFLLGLLNRFRGGWLKIKAGHTIRRILLTVGMFATGALVMPWFHALALLLIFPGLVLPWAQWMDMSTVEDNDDFTGLLGRGVLITLPSGFVLTEFFGYSALFLISGLVMAPVYWFASRYAQFQLGDVVANRFPKLEFVRSALNQFIDGFTAVGELVFFFLLGLFVLINPYV